MTDVSTPRSRARRLRNALLAGVFTLGIVGTAGTGVLLTDSHLAFADPVSVDAPVPADFSAIVAKVAPAVVSVRVKTEVAAVSDRMQQGFDQLPPGLEEFFRRFGLPNDNGGGDGNDNHPHPREGMSQGSGFFISEDGYLVTNAHVVEDGTAFTVVMDDGRELDAKLIGKDTRTDLALLKVDGSGFTYVGFAKETPKVGQWVLAVGNPFGLGGSVTAGIISAEGRDIHSGPYDNYLQIDAPVNRGNSGGPAFNVHGEVVGVNTAIYSPSGGNVGIAFAIPAKMVSEVVSQLKDNGTVTRGWLGVQIQEVTPDIAKSLGVDGTKGAIVAEALTNSPAAGAGIEANDIITEVNGHEVASPRDLSETIANIRPGEDVKITLMREGKEKQVTVKLGDMKDYDQQANAGSSQPDNSAVEPGSLKDLGLAVEPNPNGDGVVVTSVDDNGPAADKGLQVGDVITSASGKTVATAKDVESAIASQRDRGYGAVLFRVQGQNGGTRLVGVPFERG